MIKLAVRNGMTYLGEISLESIAEQYGTPFYLYDFGLIKEKIDRVKNFFGKNVELYYAVKANSNLELLRAMKPYLDGLDIASGGELEQSLLAGYKPEHLSFAGPGKTGLELRNALEKGVGIISVESERELKDIQLISDSLHIRAPITIRINPRQTVKEFTIKMGGRATQFGFDEEELSDVFAYVKENKNTLNFLGIHIYAGTQCLDEHAIVRNIEYILAVSADIRRNFGMESRVINVGGGFGVSYYDEAKELNLNDLSGMTTETFTKYVQSAGMQPRFILELGRYLIADAGIYVTRIISEKKSRGEQFYILDGGMNHHLAASGNLGSALRKNFIAKNLSNSGGEKFTCNLVGPLCTPLDLMGKNILVKAPHVGDLIGFFNSGSYGFTASPLFFLGHETPVELLVGDGPLRVIRARKKLVEFN